MPAPDHYPQEAHQCRRIIWDPNTTRSERCLRPRGHEGAHLSQSFKWHGERNAPNQFARRHTPARCTRVVYAGVRVGFKQCRLNQGHSGECFCA